MKQALIFSFLTLGSLTLKAQLFEEAQHALYNERFGTATAKFHQLIAQNPNNDAAWFGMAKAYHLQNKAQKAADSLLLAPVQVKESAYGRAALGLISLQQGRNSEAAGYFQLALQQTKEKDAGVLAAIATSHINNKNGDAHYAIELLNKAIKRDKHNASLYVSLGDAYRKIHNGSEAYKAYKEALDKNSNYAPAHHRIGEIFLTQKNPEVYLPYFNSAIEADAHYAPSLYQLYVYEFYHNPAKAMEYYNRYVSNADASLQHEYDLADLLYLNKQYDQAIAKATQIIAAQSLETQPRLYKLIGYSYAEKKDSLKALDYLQQYFARAPDSIIIGKDYETISALLMQSGNDSLATVFMVKAVEKEKDATVLFNYYKKLANIARQNKNYTEQAKWMSRYYTNNPKATNVDLYYWGLAHYLAGDYTQADTVFGLYVEKYPEQTFGYYWQAKSKALQDKEMTTGYAVPAYQKLVEVLNGNKDDANYKKWMVEAYGYLAAYEANTQKDYAEARELFEKVLEVDSENEDAKKYIAILDKQLNK